MNRVFSQNEFTKMIGVCRKFFLNAQELQEVEVIRVGGQRPVVIVSNTLNTLLSNYHVAKIKKDEQRKFDKTIRISNRVLLGFWR